MEKGHNAFIVYDDLSNHAVAYRQMALLLRRPPGREAYPGDIFYVHSSLLERSAQMNKNASGGSLTSFPVIETQCGDVSSYIPTNVISITDGQIYLSTDLFNKGIRPAIHIGLSVSRVGSSAQNATIKHVSRKLKVQMSEFNKLVGSTSISTDVDPSLVGKINIGLRLREIFKQRLPRPYYQQVLIGYTSFSGVTSNVKPEFIMLYYKLLLNENFMRQFIQRCNYTLADKDNWYAGEYLCNPNNFLYNFFLRAFEIQNVAKEIKIDTIFEQYTKVFLNQFQPRLEKLMQKKKLTFY
jgi:F-type H+-transporting ATPase subunit alpha